MDFPEFRIEGMKRWVVFYSENVVGVYRLGILITGYSALVQLILSPEYNFTHYYCNTFFNTCFNTNTSAHFASALNLANAFRVKLVINSDYFPKPC
jgi:hypothetical protein